MTMLTRCWAGLAILVSLWACVQAAPPADQTIAPPNELAGMAQRGQFDQVLASLKAGSVGDKDPRVASLMLDLERHGQNRAKWDATRAEAYAKSMATMAEKADADKLEEALLSAVEAHGLAADKQAMLADPRVRTLLDQTKSEAARAEKDGDWIEALSLYRALDLLFDDAATFRKDVKRTARHARVLRLYAPAELQRLSMERFKRMGKEEDEPPKLGSDTWEDTLKGAELPMLREMIRSAARRHVNTPHYKGMLDGAIGALLILVDTPAAAASFPAFKEPARVAAMRTGLTTLRADVAGRNDLNLMDAVGIIDHIITLNGKTLNLPEEVLVFEMADGVSDTLDDFTAVIWPQEKESFSRNTSGKFGGVGIQISQRDDRLVVVSPLENTPAQKAGIRAGDFIVSVDGEDTSTWSLDQAVRRITGTEGTDVTLGVERPGQKDVLSFKLTRQEIVIESIRGWEHKASGGWDYFIDPNLKIGYVRLSQFIPQSADDLEKAIEQMEAEGGVNGMILDLRFNPGGLLSSAVEVVDKFITAGPIVSTVGPTGVKTSEFKAHADGTHRALPVVVLINEGSASASEIVSGALQDYQRALIVGTRSFGKGSVQDLFPIDAGRAYLKLTTQYYKLPGNAQHPGRIIHRQPESKTWGVEPDLVVDMTTQQVADGILFRQQVDILRDADAPADPENPPARAADILEKAMDPQLEAALLVLKTQLVARDVVLARGEQPARNP